MKVAIITLLFGCLTLVHAATPPPVRHWGCVLDAGSSGTRIHIFSWGERFTANTDPNITEYIPSNSTDANALQNSLPISNYAGNPQDLAATLQPLLDQAKRWVPSASQSATPLILRATAGMRLLNTSSQNIIFDAIRVLFRDTTKNPFMFKDGWATIASGEQEAVWSWVMANYVEGNLIPNADPTNYVGTFEMGGASVQICFLPSDELLNNQYTITIFGTEVPLYAQSFLQFGKDQFRDRVRWLGVTKQAPNTTIYLPCFYTGYTDHWVGPDGVNYTFIGTSDWNTCYWNYSQELMGLNVQCIQPPCSFMGVYQPALPTPRTYWGISAYFYTLNGIGLVGWNAVWEGTANDMAPAAQAQCSKNWTQALADLPGTDPAFVASYCSDASLMLNLLRAHGASNINVTYSRKSKGQSVGWPLGGLIDALNLLPLDMKPSSAWKQTPTPVALALFFILLCFYGMV